MLSTANGRTSCEEVVVTPHAACSHQPASLLGTNGWRHSVMKSTPIPSRGELWKISLSGVYIIFICILPKGCITFLQNVEYGENQCLFLKSLIGWLKSSAEFCRHRKNSFESKPTENNLVIKCILTSWEHKLNLQFRAKIDLECCCNCTCYLYNVWYTTYEYK